MEYQQRNECTDAHAENQDGEAVTRLECFPGLLPAEHDSSVTDRSLSGNSPAEPASGSRVELRKSYSSNLAERLSAGLLKRLGWRHERDSNVGMDADFGNLRAAVRGVR
jgi:hypothetical protein